MIAPGSSVRGLSEVTTATSASSAAIRPMSGRLPLSRSPPQPNTTTSRPGGQRPQRRQRPLQRVGRVGVVAQHDTGRLAEQLHPAGHLGRRRRAARPPRRAGRPSPSAHAGRGQRVGDVEVAQQRQRHLGRPEAAVEPEPAARRVEHDLRGADVRRRMQPEGHPARAGGQHLPGAVVEVHHLDARLGQHAAELELGGEVRLHRPVIVEVVAGQVGEHARREA